MNAWLAGHVNPARQMKQNPTVVPWTNRTELFFNVNYSFTAI